MLLGLALLLGTEQGMASLAALALARVALSFRNGWRDQRTRFAVEAGTAIAAFLIIVAVLAGSHTLSVLRFNFREVPQDQLWYFGAPPNPFLWRWSQIPAIIATRPRWWVTIGAAVVIALIGAWRGDKASDQRRLIANLFLVLYGLISLTSMLGMIIPAYAQPATRVAVIVVLGWLYQMWTMKRERFGDRRIGPAVPVLLTALLIVVSFLREEPAMMGLVRSPTHFTRVHLMDGVGPAMSEPWVQTQITGLSEVERLRRSLGHDPVIWSTYAGLLEWQVGVFHPATDYIIHTLGPKRRSEYASLFVADRPDLVQTIRPPFTGYEEWLEGTHWDFYRPLLERYDVAATGPWSFFWTRRDSVAAPALAPLLEMAVPPNTLTLSTSPQLPADSIGVFEVRLRYHTHNPLAAIPVLGGLPRYLIDLPGSTNLYPVSLAPYATERSFPVVIRGESPIIIRGYVASLIGGATLTLDSVRIQRIPISRANGIWMHDFVDRSGTAGR